MFKFKKGEETDHDEIKTIQYGIFVTMKSGTWEFRTIEEVNLQKSEMDKQMKDLIEKTNKITN